MAIAKRTRLTNKVAAMLTRLFKGGEKWTLRTAAVGVVTGTYVPSSHMPCDGATTVGLWITLADADYTSITLQYEVSYDDTNFHALPNATRDGPWIDTFVLANFQSATATKFCVPVSVPFGVRSLRVSVLKAGGTAVGSALIEGIEGGGV